MSQMRWPWMQSLQLRLCLSLTAGLVVLWLLAIGLASHRLRHEIDEVFDSALQEVAQRVLPLAYLDLLNNEPGATDAAAPARIPSVGPHREHITYVVRNAAGRIVMQSHDADLSLFTGPVAVGFADGGKTRLYTESAVSNTIFVTTAERPGHRQVALHGAIRAMVWPLVLLLPFGVIGAWALVALSLQPVMRFRKDIQSRSSHHLSPVSSEGLPSEIVPVALAVNNLMARMRRALDAERSFTANSAHELRTPVAAALAQMQRLKAELADPASGARVAEVETALKRLARLMEKLLQLARSEGGGLLSDTPSDLAAGLRIVLDEFRRAGVSDPRLKLDLSPDLAVLSPLDLDAFAILARNLIENALKHGDPAQPIVVALDHDGMLTITNHGPVVPAADLDRLLQRFERGGADGAGLGLAISHSIAAGAGGTLALASPVPGVADGFQAQARLPVWVLHKLTRG
jgi:two-component system, OmpR family, sensor kinase